MASEAAEKWWVEPSTFGDMDVNLLDTVGVRRIATESFDAGAASERERLMAPSPCGVSGHKVTDWVIVHEIDISDRAVGCIGKTTENQYGCTSCVREAESRKDTELLNWLEDYLKGGCVDTCFEIDGGIHATFSEMGSTAVEFRDQDTFRQALRQMLVRSK